MQEYLKIKLNKKHSVYGRFRGSLRQPLLIVVHGLPGDIHDSLCEHAARWFTKNGFATFQFNLYGYEKDARQLVDCTLKAHASDLDAIVHYFRKHGSKKIFVAGHSYGGPTILLSRDQDFDAVTLWDPSYRISFTKKCYGFPSGKYVKAVNGYFMRWGANVIIGNAMAKEADALAWDHLTRQFHAPVKFIAAGKGVLVRGIKTYYRHANEPKEMTIIKGATHYFDDTPRMRETLFKASKEWFEAIVRR